MIADRLRAAFSFGALIAQPDPSELPTLCGQRNAGTDNDQRKCRAQASRGDAVDTSPDDRRCFVHFTQFLGYPALNGLFLPRINWLRVC